MVTSVTACTAIVLGKLSATDFPLEEAGTSNSSSSSGSAPGPCSLLADQFGNQAPVPDNQCSTCIATTCKDEVTYACNPSGQPKQWFQKLGVCAQRPYAGFAPPEAGTEADSYGCTTYADAGPAISDHGSDAEHEQASKICVQNNCMQGVTPACRLCVVSIAKTNSISYLADDPCGSCIAQNCQSEIVACCDSQPMQDYVKHCAFTADTSTNKGLCQELGDAAVGDGGRFDGPRGYETNDQVCMARLAACYQASCLSSCQ